MGSNYGPAGGKFASKDIRVSCYQPLCLFWLIINTVLQFQGGRGGGRGGGGGQLQGDSSGFGGGDSFGGFEDSTAGGFQQSTGAAEEW